MIQTENNKLIENYQIYHSIQHAVGYHLWQL